jgi:hypothetical protein
MRSRTAKTLLLAALLGLATTPALAASVSVRINGLPYPGNQAAYRLTQGTPITIEIVIKGGRASGPVTLPRVEGTTLNGTGTNPQPGSDTYSFFLTPNHAGPVVIPHFDLKTRDGEVLHVDAVTLMVGR